MKLHLSSQRYGQHKQTDIKDELALETSATMSSPFLVLEATRLVLLVINFQLKHIQKPIHNQHPSLSF